MSLVDLWLPILLSGVFIWVGSALIHMVLKYHSSDYLPLENEGSIANTIGTDLKPGVYSMPYCKDMKSMSDPELQKRFVDGPVAFITIFNKGLPPMGKLLGQQFLFFLLGTFLIAYISTLSSLNVASSGGDVFRFIFSVGFVAFGWANIPYAIWYGHRWSTTLKYMLDALIYSAITALTFMWLWPSAV